MSKPCFGVGVLTPPDVDGNLPVYTKAFTLHVQRLGRKYMPQSKILHVPLTERNSSNADIILMQGIGTFSDVLNLRQMCSGLFSTVQICYEGQPPVAQIPVTYRYYLPTSLGENFCKSVLKLHAEKFLVTVIKPYLLMKA